ncbi:reverse transcriptase domain-containing protein [Tanacetum coccineum]
MSTQSSSNHIELHFPNPEKSLQFRIENAIVVTAVLANEFELKTELLDFVRAAKTWLENEPPNSITSWDDLVSKFLNRFYPHSKTRELRKEIMNFQQVFVSSSGGSSIQNDAITALTKQVEALVHHISSMQEAYNQNQEASIQSMQNQMGQMVEAFQEISLGVLPSNTVTDPLAELNVITSMDGLTLDGSFTPHSNFLVYQKEETEPKTITEVKSSGSTTTHSGFSLPEYDSFIFDLSIDPFPPTNRSDSHHEEFTDELTHIITLPEYDYFYFDIEPDPGELTILCEENISKESTKELTSPELNDFPLLLSDCVSTFSVEFSEIDLLVLFPSRNKVKIFDPGIFIIKRVQS